MKILILRKKENTVASLLTVLKCSSYCSSRWWRNKTTTPLFHPLKHNLQYIYTSKGIYKPVAIIVVVVAVIIIMVLLGSFSNKNEKLNWMVKIELVCWEHSENWNKNTQSHIVRDYIQFPIFHSLRPIYTFVFHTTFTPIVSCCIYYLYPQRIESHEKIRETEENRWSWINEPKERKDDFFLSAIIFLLFLFFPSVGSSSFFL